MAARVLDLMQGVTASATIDEARARANIARSFATITELADTLVREEGIPFGRAHHVAAQLARAMKESGDGSGQRALCPLCRRLRRDLRPRA